MGSRQDLTYLIGEMQGELANSHTYVGGGDEDDPVDSLPTPLLGADFALDGVRAAINSRRSIRATTRGTIIAAR